MEYKKVLVTGGTGFIGSNLAIELHKAGYEVNIFYREGDENKFLDILPFNHFKGDINDKAQLRKAMQSCDAVFHTVGMVSFSPSDKEVQYKVNVNGTKAVVEAAKDAKVKRLHITSSVSALGCTTDDGQLATEETPYCFQDYDDYYGSTKREAELYALKHNSETLEVLSLLPATVFGQGDVNFNGGSLIRQVKQGLVRTVPKGGLSCVHIDSVVQGHIAALTKGRPGERYILGGENLKTTQIVKIVAEELGKQNYQVFELPNQVIIIMATVIQELAHFFKQRTLISKAGAQIGCHNSWFSSKKSEEELDYKVIPFRKAVRDAIDFYNKHDML